MSDLFHLAGTPGASHPPRMTRPKRHDPHARKRIVRRDALTILWFRLAPTLADFRAQLAWLKATLAEPYPVEAVLSVPQRTIKAWINRETVPNDAARKLVWLVYMSIRYPGRLRYYSDLATWGRYAQHRGYRRQLTPGGKVIPDPQDWSDWRI